MNFFNLSYGHDYCDKYTTSVYYDTISGNRQTERIARKIASVIKSPKCRLLSDEAIVDLCVNDSNHNLTRNKLVVFVVPTSVGGNTTERYQKLIDQIYIEFLNEFRFDLSSFKDLKFVVIGVGDSQYGDVNYCKGAYILIDTLLKLKPKHIFLDLLNVFDDNVLSYISSDTPSQSMEGAWSSVLMTLKVTITHKPSSVDDIRHFHAIRVTRAVVEKENRNSSQEHTCGDLEKENENTSEMLNKRQRDQLVKEGYKLIGSHSAVKLCRWTKHQVRGQGGCYKHTFYGIQSHQCMEATPSLACANKCVFCWRHHKNPVGTSWKWLMDDPKFIAKEAVRLHLKMIKELKGIARIQPDKFDESKTIKHCALSLVGEPIMYPAINELINELHTRHISTFLVTNCQFPDAIENLVPVTQLYVSIDAGNAIDLKAVDQPLFSDYWERFIKCLTLLRQKQPRTIYRLTLVEKLNMKSVLEYARLIEIGSPDFIEVKAVTYCGTSDANSISMANVPWYEDVYNFCQDIVDACKSIDITNYEICCVHRHSCSVLIGNTSKFLINDQWHTWIDYEKFYELIESNSNFTSEDYSTLTPHWSLAGSAEEGFDPEQKRYYRKGKQPINNS